ncbi:MAG: hypothetical protein ABIV51_06155 [Saprospiraceae bacterium]
MDHTELKKALVGFVEACEKKGKKLLDFCLVEAYPGNSATSYFIEVKANWIDEMDCSDAIDFLFDVLFETTTAEIRKKIYSIKVFGPTDELHCMSHPLSYGLLEQTE